MKKQYLLPTMAAMVCALSSGAAFAAEPPVFDTGDTAWMLTATALVLMMTIPGLALFYGSLVRKENVLATMMQSFATCCIVSVLWVIIGYSLAFSEGSSFVGGMDRFLLAGMGLDSASGTIPESVFVMFQMTFAIITPALIYGAVADRMNFSAAVWFTSLWLIVVYAPVCHWVWGPGGFIGGTGLENYEGFLGLGTAIDFAGGTVVHINAGVAGLVAALVLGPRQGYRTGTQFMPHNLVLCVIGASLLWVGWFGFNAGSAVASGDRAGMAMLVTQVATAAAALAWMFAEWMKHGKPSVLGVCSGAVAGLVAITPASGFVETPGALIIGVAAGVVCFWAASSLKKALKYDDSLDAFGIHGIGGMVGSILTGVLAVESVGGVAGSMDQMIAQIVASLTVALYSAVMTWFLLMVIKQFTKLRVDAEVEDSGLDLALHGERVQ